MSEGFLKSIKKSLGLGDSIKTEQNVQKSLPASLTAEKIDSEIKDIVSKETGVDRIKEMFRFDETLGKRPDYLTENFDILSSVGVSGFILGAVLKAGEASESFKKNTQLTLYTDKKAATREFADYIYLQTVKGGTKTSLKFMTFSGLIIGSSLLIQAYRNKSSPLDYTIGGAVSGGILRMHYGLRNLIFGAVVGSLFGTIFGIARYSQLKLMGLTYEERRYNSLRDKIIYRELLLDPIGKDDQNK